MRECPACTVYPADIELIYTKQASQTSNRDQQYAVLLNVGSYYIHSLSTTTVPHNISYRVRLCCTTINGRKVGNRMAVPIFLRNARPRDLQNVTCVAGCTSTRFSPVNNRTHPH